MQVINTNNAPQAIGPYVQAMEISPSEVGGLIYTSGQIPLDKEGNDALFQEGVQAQTKQVIENLKAVLESAGSSLDKIVKTTVFLADMEDFAKMNEIYNQYFDTHKPARSAIAVKTLPKHARVEIEAIAVK